MMPMTDPQALECLERACAAGELHVTVDLAAAPNALERVTVTQAQAHCLLADAKVEAAATVGPWLLASIGQQTLRETLALAATAPAVTWLVSGLAASELAARLGRRMNAVLADGQPILLRCCDPRILAELDACLAGAPRAAMFALGSAWFYKDRDGRFCAISMPKIEVVDPVFDTLVLDEPAEQALVLSTMAARLVRNTFELAPDILLRGAAGQQFALAKRCIAALRAVGIDSLGPAQGLLLAASARGGDWLDGHTCTQALQRVKAQPTQVESVIDELVASDA